jgi:hypothetical protein
MVYLTPASGEAYEVHPACLPLSERFANGSSSHTFQHATISYRYLQELKGVERERISLAVHVMLKNRQTCRIAEIGQTAW